MRIVVLVKHVPEATSSWRLCDDLVLDRDAGPGSLSPLDEYAVDQAVKLAAGCAAEITCLTMGPAPAADALRKALAMGGTDGVHVLDDAIRGSDALATSLILAEAIQRVGFDLIVCGMASTDAEMSVVPSMLAERLGIPQATLARSLSLDGTALTIRRETDRAAEEVVVQLPAVVSVTDQSGEPAYPSFKSIMAARRKPVQTWSLADLGLDPATVGLGASRVVMHDAQRRPPRTAGTIVADDGQGAVRLAEFLTESHFL